MFRRIAIALSLFAAASATSNAAVLVATRSVEAAPVVAVQATRVADVVLLGAGFDAGLRQGMVFSVSRAGADIAEVVLVELRPRAAAALIVQLAPGQSIRAGDIATVKTLKV
ncbi:MAG: hypothetical protein WC205_18080 [Opitutaceae bacterium]|jgi:hypothetical protein